MSFVNRESPYQMPVFVEGQAGWSALSDFLAILSQGAGSLLLDYAKGLKLQCCQILSDREGCDGF